MKGYRFVTEDLKSQHGDVQWLISKWRKCKGELSLCNNGFHASQKPLDSLNYIFGTRWFECEAKGKILKDTNKFCASEMRLLKEIPNKVIQQFSIDCAWRVLHIFEEKYPTDKRPRQAIEVAKLYLQFPTQENREKLTAARAAAWAAAGTAAWDAAGAAAGDAAWDAAGAAAGAAAWDAAWDAAGAAAGAAARAAAWAAAGTAAWDAAGAAAWDAAWDAAGAAAGDAETKWQNRHLLNLIRKGVK